MRRWPIVYVALGLPLIGGYVLLDEPGSGLSFLAVSLLTVVALLVGMRVMKPAWRTPWYLLLLGQLAFLAGDLGWYALEFAGQAPEGVSFGDVFYLVGYPAIALGVLLFIRARQPRYTLTAALDAVVVGVAASAVLWLLVGEAIIHDESLPWLDRAVLLAYPLGDVMLLSAAAYLLLSGRQRIPAFALLTASLASLLVADVLYALNSAAEDVPALWADIVWLSSYLLFGLTALVPSMRQLTEPGDAPHAAEGKRRLLLLGVSISVLPTFAFVQDALWHHVDYFFLLPLAAVVVAALLLRMHELVRVHARAEQRYASLLANASDAFAIVRSDGMLTYGSPASESVLDYASAQLQGRSLVGLLHPEDVPAAVRLLADVAAGQRGPTEIELRVQRRDGSWRWLSMLATERIGDPIVAGIVLNIRDVTERREAEERLRLQARVLEEVRHAVVVTDPQGRVTYWNPAARALYGWSEAEVLGRRLVELTQPTAQNTQTPITPVLQEGGRWSGELKLTRKDGSRLTALVSDSAIVDDDGQVRGIIGVSFDISERKRLEERLQRQAFSDALTGLANRALYLDRVTNALTRARRVPQPRLAVLFLDIDDFKTVNDSLGHSAGDLLLVSVAQRLQASLRAADTAARLGGDEFGLLLEDADLDEAEQVAKRILATVSQPVELLGREVRVTCSVGIATPSSGAAETAEDLLRNADLAMYGAKKRQTGTYAVYRPEMHTAAVRRLHLKADLERALADEELELVYQPIIRLSDGRPVGAEALLRWTHPELGAVPAPEAIALAEESGLVLELGRWVMQTAFLHARQWQIGAAAVAAPYVTINATVRELLDERYAHQLSSALRNAGLPASSVAIEITENALMAETEAASPALARLKAIGVRLAIDDFGTGYSSLNYLTRFPLDVLKIDRSFVARETSARENWAIARSIIELARSLDLEVIAEGIEHAEEAAALSSMGCHYGQGYSLGRPLSGAEVATLFGPAADSALTSLRAPTYLGRAAGEA
ncbi:MAG TPA: EAL domain-containing protein [Candidatus Limnocylindria bacterium]|nr:EAL domain-containing protein [Candidatus Limnocylindria bacterium]